MHEFLIENEDAMWSFGMSFAQGLRAGDVIALYGDLGTGKTFLTKAIAAGLDIEEPVTSPSFMILHEYGGGILPLHHFDVYRLAEDAAEEGASGGEIGMEEAFYGDGVSVVEWANYVESLLPKKTIRIALAYGVEEGTRLCRVAERGEALCVF